MRVFVIGGTGTISSAVIAELLGNHHRVLALARSDSSAQTLERRSPARRAREPRHPSGRGPTVG